MCLDMFMWGHTCKHMTVNCALLCGLEGPCVGLGGNHILRFVTWGNGAAQGRPVKIGNATHRKDAYSVTIWSSLRTLACLYCSAGAA